MHQDMLRKRNYPIMERLMKDISEKLIQFGGGQSYGQIVFMAGGAGSGKGFVIKNFLEGNKFKVRDIDEYKVAFLKLAKTMEKYSELRNLDLRKPGDVFKLHVFVKELGVKEKSFDDLLSDIFNNNSSIKGTLPNIIFDITLKDVGDITDILPYLMKAGYNPRDIHLVWVLTDYNIAIKNNAKRSRVVPEDILILTHKGAANTMKNIIHGHLPSGLDGRIDIVLNNPENTIWYKSKDGDKSVGVVKDFIYMNVKKPGKAVDHTLAMRKQLFDWINKNTPIHLDSWD